MFIRLLFSIISRTNPKTDFILIHIHLWQVDIKDEVDEFVRFLLVPWVILILVALVHRARARVVALIQDRV